MADKPKYIKPRAFALMSQREIDEHMDALSEAGMDDGPEWDAMYRVWEKVNGQEDD